MLQIGELEDSETQPLLYREKPTLFQRTLGVFKTSKDPAKLPPIDNIDLMQVIDEAQYSWWTKYYNSIYTYQVSELKFLNPQLFKITILLSKLVTSRICINIAW